MRKVLFAIAMAMISTTINAQEILTEGFEQGELIGWTVWESKPNIKVQKEDVHSGEYAARLYKMAGIDRNIMLKPGRYMLTFYTKHIMGEGGVVALRRKADDDWKFTDVARVQIPTTTTEFEISTINFRVKSEGLYKIVAQTPQTRQYIIDDIVLKQLEQ